MINLLSLSTDLSMRPAECAKRLTSIPSTCPLGPKLAVSGGHDPHQVIMLTKEDKVSTCPAQLKLAICGGHDPFLDHTDHQRILKKPGSVRESWKYLRPIKKATESCGRKFAVAASLQRAAKTNAMKFVVFVSSHGESG